MKIWCFDDAHFWGKNLFDAAKVRGHEVTMFDDARKPDIGHVFMHMHHHPMVRTFHKRSMATLALNPNLALIPDYRSSVLYDDKLEQARQLSKWLPRTRVFYSKAPAWSWLENEAKFPFISKSSEGSSSNNVRMINTLDDAREEIRLAFSSFGIKCHYGLIQRGYLLWQDFVPDNAYDVRIVAIGNKRMMMVRDNREDRPMASGSGRIHPIRSLNDANPEVMNALAKAEVFFRAERFKWCGIDMVFDKANGKWLIIEVTVGWTMHSYNECEFIENFKPTGRKGSDVWNVLLDEMEKGSFE